MTFCRRAPEVVSSARAVGSHVEKASGTQEGSVVYVCASYGFIRKDGDVTGEDIFARRRAGDASSSAVPRRASGGAARRGWNAGRISVTAAQRWRSVDARRGIAVENGRCDAQVHLVDVDFTPRMRDRVSSELATIRSRPKAVEVRLEDGRGKGRGERSAEDVAWPRDRRGSGVLGAPAPRGAPPSRPREATPPGASPAPTPSWRGSTRAAASP